MSARQLPPLNALKAFDAAARNGGFRAAANELNVTHSAVGRHVRGLEARLGVKLFETTKSGVELTEAGWLYAQRISESLQDIAAATEDICGKFGTSRLHIRAIAGFCSRWLVPNLPALMERFPSATIIAEPFTDVEDWEMGGADFAIGFGNPEDLEGECELLFSEPVYPVCSPSYLEREGPIRKASDLQQADLLHEDYGDWWRKWFAANGISFRQRTRSVLWNAAQTVDAAIDGQGVALASDMMAAAELASGRLVRLPGREMADGAYWVIWREKKPRAGVALEVANWIKREVGARPDRGELQITRPPGA
ncbi:MAG: LysR substrate-binding domain-containing protein [Pseudomonadota bacterium]